MKPPIGVAGPLRDLRRQTSHHGREMRSRHTNPVHQLHDQARSVVCEDAAFSHEEVKLLRRQPGREGRVDLVQLLGGELEVLIDRRLEVILHVEGHVGDRLPLHHLHE